MGETSEQCEALLRRDAERNRQRILEAASRLTGEQGLGISHDEIAREAKVGVGTVYRRFPTRDSLLDATYRQQLDAMVAVAEESARIEDPWEALQDFLERWFEQQATNLGLRELLTGQGIATSVAQRARERIGPVVADLVLRSQQAGQLKPSLAATDIAMIPVMVNAMMRATREVDPQQWRRWLAILLEGLAAGPLSRKRLRRSLVRRGRR